MFKQLRNLFAGNTEDFQALIKSGAQVIDVRSKAEFDEGHLKGSVNIPLQQLGRQLDRIKKEKAVIVCCASGMRSRSAKDLLASNGYTVYNGGGWMGLERKIKAK